MRTDQSWLLPTEVGAMELAERLRGKLHATLAVDRRQPVVLHDTFAWQLWQKGVLLCKLGATCALCPLEELSLEEAVAVCDVAGAAPRFWWDWPSGQMRETLRPLIGVRSLVPIAEVVVVTQRIDLRNRDDKTVVRRVA